MRKPLSGALWGIVLGLAVAIILQQQGVWPLDKITVFLLPGAIGLIGILITSVGRAGSTRALTVSLIITIPLAVYGATGFTTLNEVGQLNGGCEVQAQTSVPDTTFVTDTSKQDPFSIDPNGSLTWGATSPVAFMDYDWDLWVEIGGFQVPLDSGHEGNEGGSQVNGGNVPNVTQYADARGIDISQLRGVYKVGGQAADTCAGFGFVELIADPLETLASKIALAVAILATIILLLVALTGRRRPVAVPVDPTGSDGADAGSDFDDGSDQMPAGATGVAGGAIAAAPTDEGDQEEDDDND
ncbi:MAG: hypothetical protein O7C01_08690 [Actinobacteria bacterium]|nr:hypothetical protein [Actinomycetota bacterium]